MLEKDVFLNGNVGNLFAKVFFGVPQIRNLETDLGKLVGIKRRDARFCRSE